MTQNNSIESRKKKKHENMDYVIRKTCGPCMGPILENVTLHNSILI